jgi:arylsulfatase A-like enzyme
VSDILKIRSEDRVRLIKGRYAVAALCGLSMVVMPPTAAPVVQASAPLPNVVFILTDDQRADTLWAMPEVQMQLVAHGVNFTDAFVSNPECCPSRAAILTGNYSHTTGVYTNRSSSVGGFRAFDDSSTLATWLDGAGYRTGLIGKYLNGYSPTSQYVPPGWDRWFVGDGYFNYLVNDQGVVVSYGSAPEDYSTDVLAQQADEFIRQTPAGEPLFLYFAPRAPHTPATPAPRHADAFSDLQVVHPPSYNEADVSDKPAYVRALLPVPDGVHPFWREQYRSLLAIDEAVGTIMRSLEDTGRLAETLVVFSSDNGMTWGEHRLRDKFTPYEESIRVPLVIRFDALRQTPSIVDELVVNIDLAPTAAAAAGVGVSTDGSSLLPLIAGNSTSWRRSFLLEHLLGVAPAYCGVRHTRFTYVKYETGEEELYDLALDPYQLDNVAGDPRYWKALVKLRTRNAVLCNPPPPYTQNLP